MTTQWLPLIPAALPQTQQGLSRIRLTRRSESFGTISNTDGPGILAKSQKLGGTPRSTKDQGWSSRDHHLGLGWGEWDSWGLEEMRGYKFFES